MRKRAVPDVWSRAWFRLAEGAVAALLLMLVLQAALGFDLADSEFWRLFAFPTGNVAPIVRGLVGTLTYLGIVIPVGLGVGFLWSWARISRFRMISWPVGAVIELLRGVPPLVLVIFAAGFGSLLLRGGVPRRRVPGRDPPCRVPVRPPGPGGGRPGRRAERHAGHGTDHPPPGPPSLPSAACQRVLHRDQGHLPARRHRGHRALRRGPRVRRSRADLR